jgi:hypothetical protein
MQLEKIKRIKKTKTSKIGYIIIAFLLLFPVVCNAQEKINGFWEVPFGLTKKEAITKVKEVKKLIPKEDKDGDLMYENVVFAGKKGCTVWLWFTEDKFYTGVVIFTNENAEKMFSGYDEFKDRLKEKYGPPVFEQKSIPSYVPANDYNRKADFIMSGKGTYEAYYMAKDTRDKDISIKLAITDIPALTMFYIDDELGNERLKKKKEAEQKDF